jgi:hypothetical protein
MQRKHISEVQKINIDFVRQICHIKMAAADMGKSGRLHLSFGSSQTRPVGLKRKRAQFPLYTALICELLDRSPPARRRTGHVFNIKRAAFSPGTRALQLKMQPYR